MNRRWILWLSLALVSLLLLGCSAESLYLQFYLESQAEALAAPAGNDSNPVTFTVKQGTNVSDIAADLAAAEDWAARDPYKGAGLFQRVDVIEWKKVIG